MLVNTFFVVIDAGVRIVIGLVCTLSAGVLSAGSLVVTVTVVGPPAVVGVPLIVQVMLAPTVSAVAPEGTQLAVRPGGRLVTAHVVAVVAIGPVFVQLTICGGYGVPAVPGGKVNGLATTSGTCVGSFVVHAVHVVSALLVTVFVIVVVPLTTGVVTVTVYVVLVLLAAPTACVVVQVVPDTAPTAQLHALPSVPV